MKTLVVFYSLDGHTEFIAGVIASALGADLIKLETVRPFPTEQPAKYFKGGMSAVFKMKPKLANKNIDLAPYDNIIIGTPVWAGTYASPINTFIKNHGFKGKKVALFLCSGGGDVEKCFTNLKNSLSGNSFVGETDFIEALKQDREDISQKAADWVQSLKF